MDYYLKNQLGNTEAVIDDNCGIKKFYAIADTLTSELQINFINQVDDTETLDWDFRYKNQLLTLHYNIFNGVSVFPRHVKSVLRENNVVMEVAHFLERRAF
ncbi:MAG: hypothetical protein JWP81_4976 [Ferruginibacter sp.]|nr:hypothetical protein [Ferruginibacter sp.]